MEQRTITNEARRAQIVQAAIEVLAESGYQGATFTRITKQAGLRSPRMISYHFANKDDLLSQVLVEVFTEGARLIIAAITEETTAAGKLRAYLEANLRFLHDHPKEVRALQAIAPYVKNAEGRTYTLQASREPSVSSLADMLARGQQSGEFRDFDVRAMAVMIRGAVESAAEQFNGDPPLDLETYIRETTDTFTRAVVR
ncbi:DNA-binding transcriptional regulator, AcrR family [Amycolatopsis xylanica]|uniref:DNA-binding transcriptional regulator, AcrR family n=1 Tax=Amycolatopsis xylanica TaxID=589385 RepID=A0A1H2WFH5_9PSEU|nr:TetR/AcrR family transcriptional regulator [Amycolatopsis xylanica]SDW79285.1 DNA-binding transcriptional regulator, AcrR family [Amycolatopsis xylanica]